MGLGRKLLIKAANIDKLNHKAAYLKLITQARFCYVSDANIYAIRRSADDGYVGAGWELHHVPGKEYGEEPVSFLVKKSSLSSLATYEDEPLRRRRAVSEFRSYDPGWPVIMDRFLKSRESYNPASRPSRRSHYDYGHNIKVDDYSTYYTTPGMHRPLPQSRVPILHKSAAPLQRRVRFYEPDSTAGIFEAKRDFKYDSLDMAGIRLDMDSLLHKIYSSRARAGVRSAYDFNKAELARLDRKQNKLSKYINDFKKDTIRQRMHILWKEE